MWLWTKTQGIENKSWICYSININTIDSFTQKGNCSDKLDSCCTSYPVTNEWTKSKNNLEDWHYATCCVEVITVLLQEEEEPKAINQDLEAVCRIVVGRGWGAAQGLRKSTCLLGEMRHTTFSPELSLKHVNSFSFSANTCDPLLGRLQWVWHTETAVQCLLQRWHCRHPHQLKEHKHIHMWKSS